ncbi:MAG: hypothetical protein COA57_01085 [Flavobacteriales bacterium]|nr:MAG: hypothetical protein COA57_01085 [Flavobacteriales bacterium]
MKSFIRVFGINALVAVVVIGALLWGVFHYLNVYTLHGESITVPDFKGLKIEELDDFVRDKTVRFEISDSTYNRKLPRGVVIDQNPKPNTQVKESRKIYLTVNRKIPEMVTLPELEDASLKQAISILETYTLKVGKKILEPAECSGCVLRVEKDGKELKPGTKIEKYASVDLVLGQGESDEMIPVPNLMFLTKQELEDKLGSKMLNTTIIFEKGCKTEQDSSFALVYNQMPPPGQDAMINLGSSVNVWLTCSRSKLEEIIPDSLSFKLKNI